MKFDNIVVGDKVIIYGGGFTLSRTVHKVTCVTAKYFDVGPCRYRKDTGRRQGADRWSRDSIHPWTQEEENEIDTERRLADKRYAVKKFFDTRWTLDEQQMDTIIAMIPKTKGE